MKKFFALALAVMMLGATAMAQVNAQQAKRVPAEKSWVASDVNQTSISLNQKAMNNGTQTTVRANSPITQFPYTEGFENGASDWTLIDNDGDGYNWDPTYLFGQGYAHSGDGMISSASWISGAGALTPDNWLVSQEIQIPAGSTFELTWYDAAQDPSYPADHYAVYIATTNTVAGFTATTAVFETSLTTGDWTKRTVDLTSYAGQNVYVAFRHYNCTDWFHINLDDIFIGVAGAPDIMMNGLAQGYTNEPMSFTASSTDTTATISWTIQGGTPATATGDSISVVWTAAGTYDVVATATNAVASISTTKTVTILDCSVVETVPFVESFENGLGCWRTLDVDGDGDTWELVQYGYDGDLAVYTVYADANDNWIISPNIAIPNDGVAYQVSWYAMAYSSSYPETYEVLVSTTGASSTTNFTSIFNETLAETDYVKRTASLTAYAGDTINIAFRNTSLDMYYFFIDYVRVTGPLAPDVTIEGPAAAMGGEVVTFTAVADNATSYAWTVDGQASAETSTTLVTSFTTAGTHMIEVTATNDAGSTTATALVEIIVWGDEMYYDNGEFAGNVGAQGNIYWGVMFEAQYLANRNFLTSVDLYIPEIGTYTLNVYQDGADAPVNLIYTQSEQIAVVDQWYTITIANPVALDVTKNLWITFHCDDASYPAAGCDFTGFANGSYVSLNGAEWSLVYEVAPTLTYTWMIRATTTNGAGTAETLVSGTTVYPNPTTGMLHINAQDVQEIQVIDLNGRVVLSQTEDTSVNISNLSNGIYMVRIISENGVAMHKVVKE